MNNNSTSSARTSGQRKPNYDEESSVALIKKAKALVTANFGGKDPPDVIKKTMAEHGVDAGPVACAANLAIVESRLDANRKAASPPSAGNKTTRGPKYQGGAPVRPRIVPLCEQCAQRRGAVFDAASESYLAFLGENDPEAAWLTRDLPPTVPGFMLALYVGPESLICQQWHLILTSWSAREATS